MISLLGEILLRFDLLSKVLLERNLSYRYNIKPSRKLYEVLIVVIVATTLLLR